MNTHDGNVARLREAYEAVQAAGIPEPLQVAAFTHLLDQAEGSAAGPGDSDHTSPQVEGTGFDQVAALLRVDRAHVERVVDIDDDGVHLTTLRARLARSDREAMREVALIICACRQAIGLEEFTTFDTIRRACDAMGVLDAPNFSRAMASIDGARIRAQSARRRELKLNQVGREHAAAILLRLGGEALE